ncbi:MAG: lamin tail domain-containing protein, partial [Verrucomicrobiota bacterium]
MKRIFVFPLSLIVALLLFSSEGRAQQVIFSEVMYNPAGDQPEYIEVLNNTATPFDIALWELSGGVDYTFPDFSSSDPELTFLKAFDRLLISSVPEADLRAAYPEIPAEVRVFGPWEGLGEDGVRLSGNLGNGGERITLKNKNDSLICTFAYDDESPMWPATADGAGHSLQVVNPNRKIEDWRNWRASSAQGGSAGLADAFPAESPVSLSEVFVDEEGGLAWVELHNRSRESVSLTDWTLSFPETEIEDAAVAGQIEPGGYLTVDLGVPLGEVEGPFLVLFDAEGHAASAHRFDDLEGGSYQTYPAGSNEWYVADEPKKGAANEPVRFDSIVIHEIMFSHPVGGHGEFIELYNRGDEAVDLSGWEISEGVQFDFPVGSSLAPGGFAVIAADSIWFQENYEGAAAPLGDFENGLSNQGETIRILDARGNLVDQVDYGVGGEWPELADGLGSSMELIHPDLDNNVGGAWRDSDESGKSTMRDYKAIMNYNSQGVWHPTNDDELHLHLVGEGYVMLKDVDFHKPQSLFNPNADNLLENADKQSTDSKSNSGWVFQGTHANGFYRDGEVHVIATGRGDNRANRVEIDMVDLGSSTTAELTFSARWFYGKPRLIAQTADHAWSYEFLIDVPTNLGTPGAANSSAMESAPSVVTGLNHSPAVPTPSDDVTITARVSSLEAPEKVQVAFIEDGVGGNKESLFRRWTRNDMNDEGTGGDEIAGDGIYTGKITNMKEDGRIVAFYVEVTEASGDKTLFPKGGSEAPGLYVVDANQPDFELRTVRAVVGLQALDRIRNGSTSKHQGKYPRSSNHYWNSTVIYDESDIHYNSVIRSAGSPFHTGDRASLTLKGKWKMPKSTAFRGRIKTTFDQDPTSGRAHNDRVIRYWLYLLGHKVNDNEFIKFAVNDSNFATREEVETPGSSDFMNRLWENGNQGHLYRIDDEWDFGDNLDNQRNSKNAEWNYKSPNGHRPGRYHSEYMLRSRETEYDFSGLIG